MTGLKPWFLIDLPHEPACPAPRYLRSLQGERSIDQQHATPTHSNHPRDSRQQSPGTPIGEQFMSVSSVHMFYGKLASDMTMRNAFAQATSASVIRFAAERGYMFTPYDLQMAGETLQGHAKRVGEDVKQLMQHQQGLGAVGKAAARAVAKGAAQAAGQSPSQAAEANRIMSALQIEHLLGRLGEVFGPHGGAKTKSG